MPRPASLSGAEALDILNDPRTAEEIGLDYGLSAQRIYQVKQGKAFSVLTDASQAKYMQEFRLMLARKAEAKAKLAMQDAQLQRQLAADLDKPEEYWAEVAKNRQNFQ